MPTGVYTRTPEMIANCRKAFKGRKYSEEGKLKIKNRKYTPEDLALRSERARTRVRSEDEKERHRKSHIGNTSAKGHRLSEESKKKISEACKASFQKNPDRYRKTREAGLRGIEKQALGYSTKIEIALYKALGDMKVEYKRQHTLGGEFIVDAFIPSLNLVIEADGEYWHSLPRAIRNDAKKDIRLTNDGYKVLRIPEKDFKNGDFILTLKETL